MFTELNKLDTENEEQYLWRIGNLIDEYKLPSWRDVVDDINKELGIDEDKYLSESAYRKRYQAAKKFYNSVFMDMLPNDYVDELEEKKQELFKERQRLSDERASLNRKLREDARADVNYQALIDAIKENSKLTLPSYINHATHISGKDMVVLVSDMHLGMEANSSFGDYNSDIAMERLCEYRDNIIEYQKIQQCENVYIILLGDIINGNIHITTRLENRENAVKQTQLAAEYLSLFVYDISKHFNNTYINGVAGNHSRIGLKDQVLRDERLDDIIPWYMKAKLEHIDSIHFVNNLTKEPTISEFTIRGNYIAAVHGDYDRMDENGVAKLSMMIGTIPDIILMGHLHHNTYSSISDVDVIRSGSFCGTVDDYTISKRIIGKPQQMVFTIDETGVQDLHPVSF